MVVDILQYRTVCHITELCNAQIPLTVHLKNVSAPGERLQVSVRATFSSM
jgi:hypothetical protein